MLRNRMSLLPSPLKSCVPVFVELHAATRLATLTVPMPVAKSQPRLRLVGRRIGSIGGRHHPMVPGRIIAVVQYGAAVVYTGHVVVAQRHVIEDARPLRDGGPARNCRSCCRAAVFGVGDLVEPKIRIALPFAGFLVDQRLDAGPDRRCKRRADPP